MESSGCATCLSRRVTVPLCGLSSICSALLDEDVSASVAVCWECAALMRKCRRFAVRARQARTLLQQVERNMPFTSLCTFRKDTYDYIFIDQPDNHDYTPLSMDVDPLPDTDHTNVDDKSSIRILESTKTPVKIEIEVEQDNNVEATVSQVLPMIKNVTCLPSNVPLKKVKPTTWLQINSKGKINKIPIFDDKLSRRLAVSKSVTLPLSVVDTSSGSCQSAVKEEIEPAIKAVRICRKQRDVIGRVNPALLRSARVVDGGVSKLKKLRVAAKSSKKETQTSMSDINISAPKYINNLKNLKDAGDISREVSKKTPTQSAKSKLIADIRMAVIDNAYFKAVLLCEEEMQALRGHDRTRDQYAKSEFKCETCILGYYEESQLEDHRKVKHTRRDDSVSCDICLVHFPPGRLDEHRRGHYTLIECRACGLRVREARRMWAHVRGEHAGRRRQDMTSGAFRCPKCDVVFKSWYKRRYHIETAHKTPERVRCEYCGKSYRSRDILYTHIKKLHQQRTSVKCPTCGRSYLGLENMWAHARLAHGARAGMVFTCEPCRKTFKSIATYKAHLANTKTHNGDASTRKFQCAECDRDFVDKRSVQEHIGTVHGGIKAVQCRDCDKMFSTERQLSRHAKSAHTTLKPRRDKICEHCGKGFTTDPMLTQHLAVHSEERPYVCHCGSTFRFKAALYTHQRLKKHRTAVSKNEQQIEKQQNTLKDGDAL